MLMKKFFGATAREALQKMKADLGPEALVISNRKTGNGVEILAMAEASAADPAPAPPQAVAAAPRPVAPARPVEPAMSPEARPSGQVARPSVVAPRKSAFTSLKDFARRMEVQPAVRAAEPASDAPAANLARPMTAGIADHALAAGFADAGPPPQPTTWPAANLVHAAPAPADPEVRNGAAGPTQSEQRMFDELAAMKAMLQNQLAGFAWRDMSERRPLAVKLWREMVEAGFSAGLARTVAARLPDDFNDAQARKWLTDVLSRNIHCADASRDLVDAGGVYALVGPTGVGKTTTTAKLAARCVVKYGAQSLGLITTDSYRIGAFDQLAIYGKILGVPVHSAQSCAELEATVSTLAGKRLVLIDTTGMGQRDNRVAEQINLLGVPSIRRVLLLNAAAQAETLEDVVRAYQCPVSEPAQAPGGAARAALAGPQPLFGAILTKIDEAAKLAPALDAAARHHLLLLHVTNGQRVPEDLHGATSQALVHRALKAPTESMFALRDDELGLRAMAGAHA